MSTNLPARQASVIDWNDAKGSIRKHIAHIDDAVKGYGFAALMAYACALAGQNMVIIGPPGEGKSMFARALANGFALGAPHFEWTLARTTTPDEIFGPVSLAAYEQGRMERDTAGKLPSAGTAFLDEVFKGSSSVLNALLTMLNERTFDARPVPLRFTISASNELPDGWRQGRNGVPARVSGDDLGALWDRYTVRLIQNTKPTDDQLRDILANSSAAPLPRPAVPLTVAHLNEASAAIDALCASSDSSGFREFIRRIAAPQPEGSMVLSTRRTRSIWRLAGALAFINGAGAISAEHLALCWPALWSTEDQIETARKSVAHLVPREFLEIEAFAQKVEEMAETFSRMNRENIERFRLVSNLNSMVVEMGVRAPSLIQKLSGELRATAEENLRQARAKAIWIAKEAVADMGTP